MANSEEYKYKSDVVAKFIVATANERHLTINMTKVQKLLYIAYGIYLAVRDERLTNEHPQAWPYGPVFPTTRNRLLDVDLYGITKENEVLQEINRDEDVNALIGLVFNTFGDWSALKLTNWSHGDGTPWQRLVSSKDFSWGTQIPDDYIKSYFKSILRNA
jgi:uncharacterized phage-associated protein